MKRVTLQLLALLVMASAASAAVRNVFFAGGQSNAKQVWAEAIASGLRDGYGSSLVMVWVNHSGEALSRWFTTAPGVNYSNDLFNASGTGALQAQMQALVDAGDEPVFQGFFWFQGESDTGTNAANYATMDAYTNRFQGMLTQLRGDLALTNDVRFTLAVIDINTNYLAGSSRDLACVDYLRARQTELGSTPPGSYVDTRGYTRPSDAWHLSTDELTRLGGNMAVAFTNAFGVSLPPGETAEIFSHDADGAIYPTGTFVAQDLIVGATGTPLIQYNGVAFFPLPAQRIDAADLTLTVYQNYGPLPNANIDVWGLGYMQTPALSSAWTLLSDTDTRALINANVPFTKLADNLVAAGQAAAAGSVWQLSAPQRTNLTAFLNMLYEKGALPGDYAVLRVNPDAALAGTTNIRFGGSQRTSPDQRAKLTVTLSDEPAPSATEGVFKVFSHANDGGVYATGTSTANDLISGTGGSGTQDYNGIAFFELPEQPMTSASMSLPVVTFSGVMPSANIDVWGLGYTAAPALTTAWFCTNDVDSRLLLNGYPPVKLADNIVTAGQTVATSYVWQPSAAQADVLRLYLNGLYNKGARPGNYAVIRVNMDNRQQPVNCGVRWGGSQQTDPNKRASLSGVYPVTSNYLVNAGFEAGTGPVADSWAVQVNGFLGQRTNVSVRSGSSAYRFAVNGDQSANTANNINVLQYVNDAALAGQWVSFSGYARHDGAEPLVTGSEQRVEFRLWWLINGAQTGGFIDSATKLLPADPTNAYKLVSVSGVAPTNASGVCAQVIFRTGTLADPAITTGAAFVDDLRLTVFEPVYLQGTMIILR